MKAPNGKPTNLTERQWVQVRTKAFKEWFGDWEKAARIEKLRKSKPLVVSGNDYQGKYELNPKSATRYVLDNLRGNYVNLDTGETIRISRKGAEKVMKHDAESEAHLKSAAYIPQMIGNAVFITEEANTKEKTGFDSYRYYVLGLRMGSVDYTAKLVVGVKDGEAYYDHALTEIEKNSLLESIDPINTGFANKEDAVSAVKDKRLLSLLQTNSSKVVDENGEPRVVYHGTNESFHTFDKNKAGIGNDPGMRGKGFYLSTNRRTSEGYGNNIMECFVNLKNPFNPFDFAYKKDIASALNIAEDTFEFIPHERFVVGGLFSGLLRASIEDAGYDGIQYLHRQEYVAFYPNQIKSATDNTGSFSSENADIRFRMDNDLEEVNRRFNEELERYQQGKMSKNEMFHLGLPNGVMSILLPNLPIVMRQRVVNKGANKKHNVEVSSIINMPQKISEPIFVFKKDDKSLSILSEMKDKIGRNVFVAFDLSSEIQDGGRYIEVNDVTTVHGRRIENIIRPINENNSLQWVDKKKALEWFSSASPNVQQEITCSRT